MRSISPGMAGLLLLLILMGCNPSIKRPPGSGAREAAQSYYEAILQKDWPGAYAALDSSSRTRLTVSQYTRLGENYRRNLGFEPESIAIRAWDEQGNAATVHVIWTGTALNKTHHFKDAIRLQLSEEGWRIVLPTSFGQKRTR